MYKLVKTYIFGHIINYKICCPRIFPMNTL